MDEPLVGVERIAPGDECFSRAVRRTALERRGLRERAVGHIFLTMKPVRSIAAGEFKAKCLEVLDRVAKDGDSYLVTKRGKPVAKVVPIDVRGRASLRGSVTYRTDIVKPLGDGWPVDE